jgi:hypothetical protein
MIPCYLQRMQVYVSDAGSHSHTVNGEIVLICEQLIGHDDFVIEATRRTKPRIVQLFKCNYLQKVRTILTITAY